MQKKQNDSATSGKNKHDVGLQEQWQHRHQIK